MKFKRNEDGLYVYQPSQDYLREIAAENRDIETVNLVVDTETEYENNFMFKLLRKTSPGTPGDSSRTQSRQESSTISWGVLQLKISNRF